MSVGGYGRGRGGRRQFAGGPKECVCSNCGTKVPHVRGIPYLETKCPKGGANMFPAD